MRILHVIASMNPKTGGVCQAVRTIVNSLTILKVENEIVSLDTLDDDFIKADSFKLHALGPAKGPWAYSSFLKPWLIKNINKFDTIIVHGLWLFPSYITASCLNELKNKDKNLKTKLFVMPHGMLDPYFQKATGRKLKALRNKIYWQFIESKVVNKANGILFTCEEEKLLARKPFKPYKPQNEVVVGLGVEKPPTYTIQMRDAFLQKCPSAENKNYILFLGRIHEKKGVDLLINAFIGKITEWEKSNTQNNIPVLVVAGPDLESVFGKQILKIINAIPKINQYILFPGMLEGDAKWGAFYCCNSFILPSHQENFGIAVVEALACGKPVLISNQVNIWREINERGAGLIADDNQSGTDKLLSNWKHLFDDNKLKPMEKNALVCYEKYFAIGPFANKLLDTLK